MRDPATCADLDAVRMTHIDLQLEVDTKQRRVTGSACLLLTRAGHTESQSPLLSISLDIFCLEIQRVEAQALEASWEIRTFTDFGNALVIQLPTPVQTLAQFELRIEYFTNPGSPGVCWLEKEQTAGKKHPYVYTQGQEVLNRSFFPCQDTPSVRITYSADIIVPAELVCVMSAEKKGSVLDKNDPSKKHFSFEMKQSIPVYLVAMAVGDLAFAQVGPRSKVWTEPCMLEAAKHEFEGELEKYLSIGERLFGPYMWEEYDLVVMPPCFPYGGMENPRLTFVSPTIVAGDHSLCSGAFYDSVAAHEISHSWFGNLMTNASWSDFFLNEGFTTYAERKLVEATEGRSIMFLASKIGQAMLAEEIFSFGEDSALSRLRVPVEDGIDPGDCYNMCAYEKGYAFVCYLRHLVGSEQAFNDFLKAYCKKFQFQSITAEDMMNFYLEYFPHLSNGDNDLKGDISFKTWLHEPGFPKFTPDFSDAQEIMEQCESLAFLWKHSVIPVQANVKFMSQEAKKTWPVMQLLHFLDCVLEFKFEQKEVVLELGDALDLWHTTNAEVMFRWSRLLIKNDVANRLDVVEQFLTMQGKQKFQLPVFRALVNSQNSLCREFAVQVFDKIKLTLHVMVRERISKMLEPLSV